MFYVVGTEDVYYRTKKNTISSSPSSITNRSEAFKLWLDKGKDQSDLEEKARALYNVTK